MLGKTVTIEIFGTLSEKRLYTGHIVGGSDLRQVYVVTNMELHGEMECIIIAAALGESKNRTRLIAAVPDEVFYEPEIKQRLSKTSLKYISISCIYEKSCGAVVYRLTKQDEMKILLVKNHNGKCWTFPKGHVEENEREEETAVREIYEETGLNVTIVPGFRKISTYRPYGKIRKTAVFFLAKAEKSIVSMQPSEIDYYLWVSMDEALKMCRHDNDIKILKDVRKIIGRN